jgi:cytoskeletal protein CcmA (bactofilin family)
VQKIPAAGRTGASHDVNVKGISAALLDRRVHGETAMWNQDQIPAGAVIGSTMQIKGQIFSKGEIEILGEVEGQIDAETRLTIAPSGKAVADIRGTEVVVGGQVKGNVLASQRIVLRKGANLVGDVKTAGIVIEDGGFFKGGIDIVRPDAPSGR